MSQTPALPHAGHPFAGIDAFPVLVTERLVLREITDDDFPWYVAHFSRREIAEGQGLPPPADERTARADFERRVREPWVKRDGIRWGLCLAERGLPVSASARSPLIGSAAVFDVDAGVRSCELGYDLDPTFWGRGLMSEACRAVLDFAFTRLRMNRVQAMLMPRNLRSRSVVERLGFKAEGVLREHSFDERGELVDDAVFSILRREWRRT